MHFLILYSRWQACSASGAQQEAAAAALSGAHTHVQHIGVSGRHPSNSERDIFVCGQRLSGITIKLHYRECIVKNLESLAAEILPRPMLLPHEFASTLFHADRTKFDHIMGVENCRTFWSNVIAANELWFRKHPMGEEVIRTGGAHIIPYRVFGDDGGVGKLRNTKILHWFPAVSKERSTRLSRIPLYCEIDAVSVEDCSDFPLQRACVWSFEAMMRGYHPHFPVDSDSSRAQKTGQPLCGEFKFAFFSFEKQVYPKVFR